MTVELHEMLGEVSENLPEFISVWETVDQSVHHQPFGQGIMVDSEWVYVSNCCHQEQGLQIKRKIRILSHN